MIEAAITVQEQFTGKVPWGRWWTILKLVRPHRRALILLIVSAVSLAVADATLTICPGGVINAITRGEGHASLVKWGAIYAGLSIMFVSSVMAFITFAGKVSTHVAHDIRREAFAKLQDLSFSYFDRRPSGWLIARMTSDCSKLSRLMGWGTMDTIWGTCVILGFSVIMFALNWQLTLCVLAILPPLAYVSVVFQKKMLRTSRLVRKANSDVIASYNESIVGVRTTKALVREKGNLDEFERLTDSMCQASISNAMYSAFYVPMVATLGSVGVGLALWLGGVRTIAGGMEVGDLVVFMSAASQIAWPVQELASRFAELQAATAAVERIAELLQTEPEIQDSPQVRAAIAAHADSGDGSAVDGGPRRIRSIEFRNVSFEYKQGQRVLNDFSLAVAPGQTIALVGPTGGGKTTIVSLLCRFYEPTGGQILLDGVDYRQRSLQWLQSNLGIVLQQPHLFSGTIRQNIRYGRLEASDEEVEQAARLVNAHPFIMASPDGYDTQVGEGGGRLSTGQKQLVSFARALLADPQIFVMDEATSSVDTETERAIQAGIRTMLKGRLSFVIAHRLSTIRSADRILVVENGRIAEQGTHGELLARRGHYFHLYTNQFARERADQVMESGAQAAEGDTA